MDELKKLFVAITMFAIISSSLALAAPASKAEGTPYHREKIGPMENLTTMLGVETVKGHRAEYEPSSREIETIVNKVKTLEETSGKTLSQYPPKFLVVSGIAVDRNHISNTEDVIIIIPVDPTEKTVYMVMGDDIFKLELENYRYHEDYRMYTIILSGETNEMVLNINYGRALTASGVFGDYILELNLRGYSAKHVAGTALEKLIPTQ